MGWTLANQNLAVFYADCAKMPAMIAAEQIAALDSPTTCLIVDNAHFRPEYCEDLLALLEDVTSSIRCIFSADTGISNLLIQKPYFRSDLTALPSTTLNSHGEAVKLVSRWAQKNLNRRVGPAVTYNFVAASRVKRHFGLFYVDEDEVDYNLWILLALLRNWDGRRLPDLDELSSKASEFVDEAVVEPLLNHGIAVASLSTVVAHFHHLGVGTPADFLTKTLAFSGDDLAAAARLGIVARRSRAFWLDDGHLPYPLKIACLRDREVYADLAQRLLVDEPGVDLPYSLETAFIAGGFPGYDLVLLNRSAAGPDFSALLRRHGSIDLLALRTLLQTERSPAVLGRALVAVSQAYPRFKTSLSLDFELPKLVKVIEAARSVRAIAWLVEGLNRTTPGASQQVVTASSDAFLASALRSASDLGSVASLMWALRNADAVRASQIVALLADDEWVAFARRERKGARLGWFIFVLHDISARTAEFVVSSIGVEPFAEAARSNPTCRDLATMFWGLANASPTTATDLAQAVSPSVLRDCVVYESELMFSGMLLRFLAAADKHVAASVLRPLDLRELTSRVSSYPDENAAALFLSALSAAAPRRSVTVVTGIQRDLRYEEMSAQMQYNMFSTMNPTAMAMAGRRRDRAAQRLAAIDGLRETTAVDTLARAAPRARLTAEALWKLWTYDKDRCISIIRSQWNRTLTLLSLSPSILERAQLAITLFEADMQGFAAFIKTMTPIPLTANDVNQLGAVLHLRPTLRPEPVDLLVNGYTCSDADAARIVAAVKYRELEAVIVGIEPFAPGIAHTLMCHIDLDNLLGQDYRDSRDRALRLLLQVRPECANDVLSRIAREYDEKDAPQTSCSGLNRFSDMVWKIRNFGGRDLIEVIWVQNECSQALRDCADLGVIAHAIRMLRIHDPVGAERITVTADPDLFVSWLRADRPHEDLANCLREILLANPALGLRLVPFICEQIERTPGFGMQILVELRPVANAWNQIVTYFTPTDLARIMSWDSSLSTSATGLAILSELAPGVCRQVADQLMREFFPEKLRRLDNGYVTRRLFEVLEQIDLAIAHDAAAFIQERNLLSAIRHEILPGKTLGTIASLNFDLAKAVAREVTQTTIAFEAHDPLPFYDAVDVLGAIAKADVRLLEIYIAEIDLAKVARALLRQPLALRWVGDEAKFLRLVMAADPAKAEQLRHLAPEVVTYEALNNAALDSLGREWGDVESSF
jgi:hypothetical protein